MITLSDVSYVLPIDPDEPRFLDAVEAGIYRDESLLTGEVVASRGKCLLTVPAGAGKTLFLSSVEALIKGGVAAFEGLALEKSPKTEGRSLVLRFDFARLYVETDDEAIDIVAEGLRELFLETLARAGQRIEGAADWDTLWRDFLQKADFSSLVLLVDNLDAPYLEALSDSELLMRVETRLRNFFDAVSEASGKFRLVLVTRSSSLGPGALSDFREWSGPFLREAVRSGRLH